MPEFYLTIKCEGQIQHRGRAIIRSGIALHKARNFQGPGWTISHVMSGLAVNIIPIPRADQAREIFNQLRGAGLDWQIGLSQFKKAHYKALAAIVRVYKLR